MSSVNNPKNQTTNKRTKQWPALWSTDKSALLREVDKDMPLLAQALEHASISYQPKKSFMDSFRITKHPILAIAALTCSLVILVPPAYAWISSQIELFIGEDTTGEGLEKQLASQGVFGEATVSGKSKQKMVNITINDTTPLVDKEGNPRDLQITHEQAGKLHTNTYPLQIGTEVSFNDSKPNEQEKEAIIKAVIKAQSPRQVIAAMLDIMGKERFLEEIIVESDDKTQDEKDASDKFMKELRDTKSNKEFIDLLLSYKDTSVSITTVTKTEVVEDTN